MAKTVPLFLYTGGIRILFASDFFPFCPVLLPKIATGIRLCWFQFMGMLLV